MKRLILMRHAKSDWKMDQPDFDRPLNKRGQASATALGQWLKDNDLRPDEVLCSPSARTRETLSRLNLSDVPTHFPKPLYLAERADLRHALQAATGDTVLIVAHNPGIAYFAADIVTQAPDHDRFEDYPSGATLVVEFDVKSWFDFDKGNVAAFVVPRELV